MEYARGDKVRIIGLSFLDKLGLYLFGNRIGKPPRAWLPKEAIVLNIDITYHFPIIEGGKGMWRIPPEYLEKIEEPK